MRCEKSGFQNWRADGQRQRVLLGSIRVSGEGRYPPTRAERGAKPEQGSKLQDDDAEEGDLVGLRRIVAGAIPLPETDDEADAGLHRECRADVKDIDQRRRRRAGSSMSSISMPPSSAC